MGPRPRHSVIAVRKRPLTLVSMAASEGVFADDSVLRRVGREGILLAAGGAASIMQTSHPRIAQGVHDHSSFVADPMGRLRRTLEWMYGTAFGTRAEAERVSAVVNALHARVTGPGYRADDPELQVWVNATLLANSLVVYERIFGRLSAAEREAYYREQKTMARLLGCPEDAHPATYADFCDYYRTMVESLQISDASRTVAHHVLFPALPWPLRPLLVVVRLITIGLIPEPLRRQYGWRWTATHERLHRALMALIAAVYPWLPLRVRTLPRDICLRRMRARVRARSGARARGGGRTRDGGRARDGERRRERGREHGRGRKGERDDGVPGPSGAPGDSSPGAVTASRGAAEAGAADAPDRRPRRP